VVFAEKWFALYKENKLRFFGVGGWMGREKKKRWRNGVFDKPNQFIHFLVATTTTINTT